MLNCYTLFTLLYFLLPTNNRLLPCGVLRSAQSIPRRSKHTTYKISFKSCKHENGRIHHRSTWQAHVWFSQLKQAFYCIYVSRECIKLTRTFTMVHKKWRFTC